MSNGELLVNRGRPYHFSDLSFYLFVEGRMDEVKKKLNGF